MRRNWESKLAVSLVTAILAGGVSAVYAAASDGEPQTPTAEEVVITANRLKNQKVDTPADVTVITSQQISDRGYRTVTDAVEDVPGARVMQHGAKGFESLISLNGDQRVVIMVDGRRVNQAMGTMSVGTLDANTLPPVDMIERIEVVKGGASTLYGADAVGGVINIITKTPEETTGKIRVGYGSWGNQDLGLSVGGKNGKTGIQIGASRNKADYFKLKDTNGDTKKWPGESGYRQDNISLKLTQDFTKDDGLTLNYDYSYMHGWSPNRYPNKGFYSLIDKKTNNVGLRYDWNRNARNNGYVQAYRNYYSYFNDGDMNETDWGIEGQQNFALSDTNTLTAGLEYRNNKADNKVYYEGAHSYNNKAAFVLDQWKFAPTWQLNTGVRYDKNSRSGNRTTGSAALNKKFSKDSNAYFSWNQVFRTPTIDDLYYHSVMPYYGMVFTTMGDENLKSETGNVYNLGYNFKITPKTDASVTAFYSNLNNAIRWYTPDGGMSYYASNVEKEKKRGMTISLVHHLNNLWDVDAAYTYVRVTGFAGGVGSNYAYARDNSYAPNYYQFGVRYHDTKWNVNLRARGASGMTKDDAYGHQFGENRYLTMDLITRYKFDKSWTGFVNVYNLNNAAYAEASGATNGQDWWPMPGRRFIVGAEYSF